jgi:hypothetical protein
LRAVVRSARAKISIDNRIAIARVNGGCSVLCKSTGKTF